MRNYNHICRNSDALRHMMHCGMHAAVNHVTKPTVLCTKLFLREGHHYQVLTIIHVVGEKRS